MDVLRITIRKERAGKWPVVVELKLSENLGEVEHEDLLIFPAADYTEHLLALTLDPQAYGEYPGQALFTEGVQEIFKSSRRGPRRVILDVEDRELRKLSWHRLCYPAGNETWKFIAHDQNLPFSLAWPAQPDGVQKIYPRLDRKNIKALVVVANPGNLAEYELQSFDEGAAARAVLAGLGDIPAELLAVNVDGSAALPRLSEITGRLSDGDYAILHLVAHGQVKDSETILYLADEQGNVRPVPGQLFFDELGKIKQLPHLLFLASCDSAKEETGLGNLARRAREELGTPAVVAMSDQVPPQTAAELAEAFYHYFAVDGEADTALVKALSSLNDSEQLTVPVLYSQLEGSLFAPDSRPDRSWQLPERAPFFTGRATELVYLMDEVQPGRVLTLSGPGGMGKSALAAEVVGRLNEAGQLAERFPDGVIFHSFYNQSERRAALEQIARSFKEEPRPMPWAAAMAPFRRGILAAGLGLQENEVRKPVAELVDYSLLIRVRGGFQTHHALVHHYAQSRLQPPVEALGRLAEFYRQMAKEMMSAGAAGIVHLAGERGHMLAVLNGLTKEQEWSAAEALCRASVDYLDLAGYWTDRLKVNELGLVAVRAQNNLRNEGSWLGNMGLAYAALGQVEQAIDYYQQALAISQW